MHNTPQWLLLERHFTEYEVSLRFFYSYAHSDLVLVIPVRFPSMSRNKLSNQYDKSNTGIRTDPEENM